MGVSEKIVYKYLGNLISGISETICGLNHRSMLGRNPRGNCWTVHRGEYIGISGKNLAGNTERYNNLGGIPEEIPRNSYLRISYGISGEIPGNAVSIGNPEVIVGKITEETAGEFFLERIPGGFYEEIHGRLSKMNPRRNFWRNFERNMYLKESLVVFFKQSLWEFLNELLVDLKKNM